MPEWGRAARVRLGCALVDSRRPSLAGFRRTSALPNAQGTGVDALADVLVRRHDGPGAHGVKIVHDSLVGGLAQWFDGDVSHRAGEGFRLGTGVNARDGQRLGARS